MQEIRDAIPQQYFDRSTFTGMLYLIQDLILATALGYAGTFIDPSFDRLAVETSAMLNVNQAYVEIGRWAVWGL